MRLEDMTGLKHESKVKHAARFFAVMLTFILVASVTTSVASATPNTWDSKAAWPGAIGSTVAAYAEDSGAKYIYALESKASPLLYRYSIAGDSWSPSLLTWPVATSQGSGMVWTGGDYIYVLAGGSTNPNPFHRYSISGNSVTAMTYPIEKANTGSGLAYDGGDTIYALCTWSSGYSGTIGSFLEAYSISSGTWTYLGEAPVRMASGSSICRVGGYLYFGVGSASTYYRYTIADGTWTIMASIPSYTWGAGGAQEKVGTGYIFAIRGGSGATSLNFMRYSISDDSWVCLTDTPSNLSSANDRLAYDGTYLYMIRGYTDSSFWRYEVDLTAPSAPSLIAPDDGAETFDDTPTFEWTSVTDPSGVTYQIQVDDSEDFSSPVYSAIDLTVTNLTLPDEYSLALGKYFWHVRAKDGASNTGDWSEEWDFTVVPMGAVGVLLMPLLMLLPFAFMLRRQNRRYRY